MIAIAVALIPIVGAGIVLAWLIGRGRRVYVSKISLPFLQIDTNRFHDLPPVRLFEDLSKICINEHLRSDEILRTAKELHTSPAMMMHTGWRIVCDAYVERFSSYPCDDSLKINVKEIGGQNMEFIAMYRDIYISSLQQSQTITVGIAASYLVRAPALAERIGMRSDQRTYADELLLAAANTIVLAN